MTGWMQRLLWQTLAMSVAVLAYYVATKGLHKRYAAKWLYLAGVALLVGFLVPVRPTVTVEMKRVPVLLQAGGVMAGPGTATAPDGVQAAQGAAQSTPWQVAFFVWAFGALATVLYHGLKHARFVGAVRHWKADVRDARLLAQLEAAKRSLGIEGHDIRLAFCECISVPMLLRLKRPTILLPHGIQRECDMRLLLMHELVHYRRRDLLCRLGMLLCVAIHWFNPAIYLLVKLVTLQCEISCDEAVVTGLDMEGWHQYAMSIIGVARRHAKSYTLLTTYFSGGMKTMKKRISSVYEPAKRRTGALLLVATLLITLLAGTSIAADTAGSNGISYTLPEGAVKLDEALDAYTVSWEATDGIREYHIGVYYRLQLEEAAFENGLSGEVWTAEDLWFVSEGWVGASTVTDNSGKEYQVEAGVWDAITLPGDATEVDISALINKQAEPIALNPALNGGAESATKLALMQCTMVITAVCEEGEPIVMEIDIPVA